MVRDTWTVAKRFAAEPEVHNGRRRRARTRFRWDDHAAGPGVYEALVELAPTFDRPLYHLLETGMAIYSRKEFVIRAAPDRFPFG